LLSVIIGICAESLQNNFKEGAMDAEYKCSLRQNVITHSYIAICWSP